jgi:hypothetical protein
LTVRFTGGMLLPAGRKAVMTAWGEPEESEHLSIHALRQWLAQELKDLDKARDLRIKDANGLVDAYSRGELTAAQASDRLIAYEDRWGEALPGAHAMAHLTDDAIIAKIDETNAAENARGTKYHQRMARSAYRDLLPAIKR